MVYLFIFLIPIGASMPIMGMTLLAMFLEQLIRLTPIKKSHVRSQLSWKKPGFWFLFLFLLYLIGLTYSTNLVYGWKDIGMKVSFAIFPIFFILYDFKINGKVIVRIFLMGVFASIMINLFFAIKEWIELSHGIGHNLYYFTGSQFSKIMHRGYWATYITIGFFFLVITSLESLKEHKKKWIQTALGAFIILIFIYLSASKTAILITSLIGLWILYELYFHLKMKLISIGVILFILIAYVGLSQMNNRLNVRFVEMITATVKPLSEIDVDDPGSTGARRMTWDASLSLIKENFWIGTGTGDIKDELIKRNWKKGYSLVAEEELNSHNQWLNTQLTIGVLGTVTLLFIFITNFRIAKKNKFEKWRKGVLWILFFSLLTESVLETQVGIMPYGFILCFMGAVNIYTVKK